MTYRVSKTYDRGYFPKDTSILNLVHRQLVVGWYYGQRALLMQGANAMAFTGFSVNTKGLEAPFQRLAHTGKLMEVVMFRPRSEADKVLEAVKKMHVGVRGHTTEDVGPHPAGTYYSANDPKLSIWVLACLADSAEAVFHKFVGRLSPAERTKYWKDYKLLGELFGIPVSKMPDSYSDFKEYMHDTMTSGDLYVTDLARKMGRYVALNPPMPMLCLPGLPIIRLTVTGLLPAPIRELHGIPWAPYEEAAFQAAAFSVRQAMPFVPTLFREGRSARYYDVVAWAEAHRQKSPQSLPLP